MHVVLAEQENDQLLDGGALGPERRLFYRELVARFGHHLAVAWNLGEENTNTDAQRKDFAEYLHRLDPYDNPVVVHTFPKQQRKVYEPLLGFPHLEGVSLQTNDTTAQTREWIARSAAAGGRGWFVSTRLGRPTRASSRTPTTTTTTKCAASTCGRIHAGGAGVEWLFGYKYAHNDINLEDFRSREHMWDLTRFAIEFFQQHLPFADMTDAHELTSTRRRLRAGQSRASVYALYFAKCRTQDGTQTPRRRATRSAGITRTGRQPVERQREGSVWAGPRESGHAAGRRKAGLGVCCRAMRWIRH